MFKDLIFATYDTLATYDVTGDIQEFTPLVQEIKTRDKAKKYRRPPELKTLCKAIFSAYHAGQLTRRKRARIEQAADRAAAIIGID